MVYSVRMENGDQVTFGLPALYQEPAIDYAPISASLTEPLRVQVIESRLDAMRERIQAQKRKGKKGGKKC